MKGKKWIPALLAVSLLSGCAPTAEPQAQTVLVSLAEGDRFTVSNNGQRVNVGEDVTFELIAQSGYALTELDYSGDYRLWQDGERILLTLEEVRYPTQAHVTLSNQYFQITYDPNDGIGEPVTVRQEKGVHLRPNVSNGAELLPREGYTLIGWSTAPDGSGTTVGLGSRVTVPEDGITLYAQWRAWSGEEAFLWEERDGEAVITGYRGEEEVLTVPETLGGCPVTGLAADSFAECTARTVILPRTLRTVENGAFRDSELETLYFFDNIDSIEDAALEGCERFTTLHINAAEPPNGFAARKESCYADKVDLLMLAQGEKKLIFYGGCSMWYNLDIKQVLDAYGEEFSVIDMALNGTVNSQLQLEIMAQYMETGDVLFHTPELSSPFQMMATVNMGRKDTPLWCGLEYNYDLLAMVDMKNVTGVLDSFSWYLTRKKSETDYEGYYTDSKGRSYFGPYGEVPFARYEQIDGELSDEVSLDVRYLTAEGMERLGDWYAKFKEMGVTVYLSYASLNRSALTEEEWESADEVERVWREAVSEMEGVTLISSMKDYVYWQTDFYDTNYHLLTGQVSRNTRHWLADLAVYLPPKEQ